MTPATSALERLRAAFPEPWRLTTNFGAADFGAPCLARADLFIGPLPGAAVNVDGHGPTPDAAVDALLAAWAAATAPLREAMDAVHDALGEHRASDDSSVAEGVALWIAAAKAKDAEAIALRDRVAELEARELRAENELAAVLPEDVGPVEYIGALRDRCERRERLLAELRPVVRWGLVVHDWLWKREHENWALEEGWELCEKAADAGMAARVKYDPELHGEADADPGDEIIFPADIDPSTREWALADEPQGGGQG